MMRVTNNEFATSGQNVSACVGSSTEIAPTAASVECRTSTELGGVNIVNINKIKIHSSCEIEYVVETHLCKLCVILRSLVLRVVCPH